MSYDTRHTEDFSLASVGAHHNTLQLLKGLLFTGEHRLTLSARRNTLRCNRSDWDDMGVV